MDDDGDNNNGVCPDGLAVVTLKVPPVAVCVFIGHRFSCILHQSENIVLHFSILLSYCLRNFSARAYLQNENILMRHN